MALGRRGEPTVERLTGEPGAAQRELRDDDAELYVSRPAPLALGPGADAAGAGPASSSATEELELHPAEGHTDRRHGAVRSRAGRRAVRAATTCPTWRSRWSRRAARSTTTARTLARLAPLVEDAETVVPGHGAPHDRDAALRILDEDVDYLDALERGEERPALPEGRDTTEQREIHAENCARLRRSRGTRAGQRRWRARS